MTTVISRSSDLLRVPQENTGVSHAFLKRFYGLLLGTPGRSTLTGTAASSGGRASGALSACWRRWRKSGAFRSRPSGVSQAFLYAQVLGLQRPQPLGRPADRRRVRVPGHHRGLHPVRRKDPRSATSPGQSCPGGLSPGLSAATHGRSAGLCFLSLSYRADGSIDPVVISAVGIGEYDAALGPIEAENFIELTGPGGKVIVGPLPSVAVHNCDINYGAPTANRQPPLRVCCQRLPLCVPTAFLLCVPAAVPCAIAAVSCVCFRGLPLPKFGAPLSAARPARGRRRLRVRRRRPAADRRPLFEQPC